MPNHIEQIEELETKIKEHSIRLIEGGTFKDKNEFLRYLESDPYHCDLQKRILSLHQTSTVIVISKPPAEDKEELSNDE